MCNVQAERPHIDAILCALWKNAENLGCRLLQSQLENKDKKKLYKLQRCNCSTRMWRKLTFTYPECWPSPLLPSMLFDGTKPMDLRD